MTLSFSALAAGPVYADGDTPKVEPVVTEQPLDDVGAQGESLPFSETEELIAEEPVAGEEEMSLPPATAATETEQSLLAALPEGTEVVILNEDGENVSLASQEAAEAIIVGDPVWCPASITTPTPGMNGCSASYATFTALLADPVFLAGGKDGTIWIASNYNGADNSSITLNGAALTNLANFKLTLQGGWCDGTDVTCVGLIDLTKPSLVDVSFSITNWNNDVTLKNITFSNPSGTGVTVTTTKNITFTNVSSNSNSNVGANLDNTSGTGNVSITQSQFNGNGGYGLLVYSNGTVTLKDVNANGNGNKGVFINNTTGVGKAVILNGTNTFTGNTFEGLDIRSSGVVTLNNVTATGNGGYGIYIDNSSVKAAVNLTGSNATNANGATGLYIRSGGTISVNSIQSNSNAGNGADLVNSYAGSVGSVKLTGTNEFSFNNSYGLTVYSNGAITLNNITASNNMNNGVELENTPSVTPQPVTLTGSNFFNANGGKGLMVYSRGAITINSIQANGNNDTNADLRNDYFGSTGGVTISGTNQFNASTSGYGLYIFSRGAVLLSNISANGNNQRGVYINNVNATTPRAVTMTGTNSASGNQQSGVYINVSGAITISSLTTDGNNGYGAFLDNAWKLNNPQAVTLTGTNQFNGNNLHGLYINSFGTVLANNLTANGNGTGMGFQGSGAYILNTSNNPTPYNVTLTGVNTFNGNYRTNLYIQSDGNISISNLTANNSALGNGAYLITDTYPDGNGNVTLGGTSNVLSGNDQSNLYISAKGAVTINNLTASSSAAGDGATIYIYGAVAKALTLTGFNLFENNYYHGLYVGTNGVITLNNVTARMNGQGASYGSGVYLSNNSLSKPAKVTLTGINLFENNYTHGLFINSTGAIETNNLTANQNGGYGAYLSNTSYVGYSSVLLKGVNTFFNNGLDNLYVLASGPVSISSVTSTFAGQTGVYVNNAHDAAKPQIVTFTGINIFNDNDYHGLNVSSFGAVTLNNITANNNGSAGFFQGVWVDNYNYGSAFIPSAVTFIGTHSFNGNTSRGLEVRSLGNITLGSISITVSNNSGYGVYLKNNYSGGVGNVTLTGTSVFDGNSQTNLFIESYGTVTINNVTAQNSVNGSGVHISNELGMLAKPVFINGTNVFSNNAQAGMYVLSLGAVTLNNVTADNNPATGVSVNNTAGPVSSGVTLNGTNSFNGNGGNGLSINTNGAVITNSITATMNSNYGVYIFNNFTGSTGGVTLRGTNTFSNNSQDGLRIISRGLITLNNVTSNANTGMGAYIDNNAALIPVGVTFTGTNVFTNSAQAGIQVYTKGAVTANNITASNNAQQGMYINGGAGKVTLTGINTFNTNTATGLEIISNGIVTLNSITANNSVNGSGMNLTNNGGGITATVTLTGVNTFTGNKLTGLTINSGGAVTMTKVTADNNGTSTNSSGMYISAGGNVTVTCMSFSNNGQYGIRFNNFNFVATLKGVDLLGNTSGPTFNSGSGSIVTVAGCPLP